MGKSPKKDIETIRNIVIVTAAGIEYVTRREKRKVGKPSIKYRMQLAFYGLVDYLKPILGILTICYSIGLFIEANFNPIEWGVETRTILIFAIGMMALSYRKL